SANTAALMAQMGFESLAIGTLDASGSELDTAFNASGTPAGTNYLTGISASINDSTSQLISGEDKTYLAGSKNVGGLNQVFVTRLKADGTLDTAWGTGGTVVVRPGTAVSSEVAKIRVDANGKILILGNLKSTANAKIDSFLMQLNANGTLDTSFGADDPSN